jgi:hypothetical protein
MGRERRIKYTPFILNTALRATARSRITLAS